MGEVVPFGDRLPDKPNASVGQALFAAVQDQLSEAGVEQIPRSLIATAVRHGTTAINDGVEPEMVLVGCMLAIQRGQPQFASYIIGDCVLAKAGKKISTTQYTEMLGLLNRSEQPAVQRFRAVTESISQTRQIER